MVPNQILGPRVAAGLLVLLAAMAGCSSPGARKAGAAAAPPIPAGAGSAQAEAVAPDDLSATDAALTAAPPQSAASAAPAVDSGLIKPTAPKSYTVKRGDTLWGIATMFLRDPWLWPEVWYINPQVSNPHLIYPGDTLALAYGADGRPQIRVAQGGAARMDPRLRSSPLDAAIPTIPYSAVSAFLSRPTVLTKDQIRAAPYVLAFREEHAVGGSGHEIYVRDLQASPNDRFAVMHVGEALRDPDDGKVLGYMGIYTATALVSRTGNPAKAVLTDTERETLEGDKLLMADTDVPVNFMLRAPRSEIHGRIISVVNGEELIGQYQIVVINRGKSQGIEAGHILAVDQAGRRVVDRGGSDGWLGTSFRSKVRLPDERGGTVLVFKAYDRVSYALVVGASSVLHVNDVVRNP